MTTKVAPIWAYIGNPQTTASKACRITAAALGVIGVVAGILILTHVPGISYFGPIPAYCSIPLGGCLILPGALVNQVRIPPHFRQGRGHGGPPTAHRATPTVRPFVGGGRRLHRRDLPLIDGEAHLENLKRVSPSAEKPGTTEQVSCTCGDSSTTLCDLDGTWIHGTQEGSFPLILQSREILVTGAVMGPGAYVSRIPEPGYGPYYFVLYGAINEGTYQQIATRMSDYWTQGVKFQDNIPVVPETLAYIIIPRGAEGRIPKIDGWNIRYTYMDEWDRHDAAPRKQALLRAAAT